MNSKSWLIPFPVIFCCALFGDHAVAAVVKPNVLFICVDDLKPLLGCYGDRRVRSPNIDRLAARALLFERAYCNQAVCAPSRNALLTGMRPTTSGIYNLGTNFRQAAPDAVTLPQYFMRHGYRTEGLGKIFHVGHGNHEDPASWSVPHFQEKSIAYLLPESRANQGLTREEALFSNETNVARLPRGTAYESADVPDNAYPDGKIADEAIRRLQSAKAKQAEPFFLAVGFLKPHLPFCAPKKYWDLYDRASFTAPALRAPPEGAPSYAPTGWGELRQYSDIPQTGPLTDEQARTLIHGYHAAVSYVDAQIGRVLDELDRLGLATNTVIVLWGDHGWHLGDHGMWCKHTNYEQATRIPLLIAAPGVTKPGTRTRALAESVDLYPTLCELAGLPKPQLPQTLDGQSLVPVLKRPSRDSKEAIFHVYPRNRRGDGEILGRAVRTERYRLVEWKKPGAASDTADLELYDYQADLAETRNLAAALPKVVAKLRALLARQPEGKPQITSTTPAAARRQTDRAALFERKDTDRDGKLTREEFLANQPDPAEAPKRFERFDRNKDGLLSRDEFITMGGTR
ncbi:MAG TPA: sulfatase-like hydrolase/transferase [Verrucomicrobiae bacterium]|nr:sulfatase-like hydrolase/transferase [Verrucomicrobiae bacterium]